MEISSLASQSLLFPLQLIFNHFATGPVQRNDKMQKG